MVPRDANVGGNAAAASVAYLEYPCPKHVHFHRRDVVDPQRVGHHLSRCSPKNLPEAAVELARTALLDVIDELLHLLGLGNVVRSAAWGTAGRP